MLDPALLDGFEKNGSFNLSIIEQVLEEAKLNSYNNLYKFQLDLISIRRFDLQMQDLKLMTNLDKKTRQYPRKYVGVINGDFINPRKRLLYKRSSFFNKEISAFDVAKNPDIFSSTFLTFIDGKFVDSVKIIPREDKTLLVISIKESMNPTGVPLDYFNEMMSKNAKITVFFMPNCAYGVYTTNINVLKKYQDKLALSRFNIANNLDTDTKYITFINTNDLLFTSVITDTTNSNEMLRFYNNTSNTITNKIIHLNIFGFRNLLDQIEISGTQKFFKLPIKNMPIPKEAIMIFRNDVNGVKTFAHDITLNQYYPNVYEIVGNTNNDNLTLYVFYFEDTTNLPLKYKNDLEVYLNTVGDILSKYEDGSINPIIKNYQPTDVIYSIEDYKNSSHYPNHFNYKVYKFNSLIDSNPEIFKEYLRKQVETVTGYYLDVSNINLASKLRRDNFAEIPNPTYQETFNEDRYLFILRNEFGNDFQHLRFYIDGQAYIPDKKYKDSRYEYYYIPASLVNPDSIIEIEKFEPINFVQTINFTDLNQTQTINVNDSKITRNDIFLVDRTTGEFIPNDNYTISYIDPEGNNIDLGTDSFKKIESGQFIVKLTDSSLINKDIDVHVQRDSIYEHYKINSIDEIGNSFVFRHFVNPDKRNFRIFRNGRLLSQNLYEIEPSTTFGGETLITPLVRKEVGDEYVIDYSPVRYDVVYEQKTIDPSGVVDLRGKIPKPFDLRWYDVYLNGRRLTKKNIDIISPTLISIKNVQSLNNLVIMERDSDPSLFSLKPDLKTIIDTLWETDSSFRSTLVASKPPINNTEVDIITEVISEISLELKRFFDKVIMLKKDLINPDTNQITDEEKAGFEDLFQGNVLLLNPDKDFSPNAYPLKIFAEEN
jgi:hypothetical protein